MCSAVAANTAVGHCTVCPYIRNIIYYTYYLSRALYN